MAQPSLFSEFPVVDALKKATGAEEVKFDGKTYEPKQDKQRLAGQTLRVFNVLRQSLVWLTLEELQTKTGDPQASISARLRDLRKPRFGAHTVERRRRGDPKQGLFEYRLVV